MRTILAVVAATVGLAFLPQSATACPGSHAARHPVRGVVGHLFHRHHRAGVSVQVCPQFVTPAPQIPCPQPMPSKPLPPPVEAKPKVVTPAAIVQAAPVYAAPAYAVRAYAAPQPVSVRRTRTVERSGYAATPVRGFFAAPLATITGGCPNGQCPGR